MMTGVVSMKSRAARSNRLLLLATAGNHGSVRSANTFL